MRAIVSLALLSALTAVSPALAHHVSGVVYCDTDGSNTITASDTKLNGVLVRATSTGPIQVGDTFEATSPYNGQTGRFYIDLITGTNNYTVAIAGGAPVGATFISPAAGSTSISVVAGNPNLEAQVVDFLLGNCSGAPVCPPSCQDNNPCTDDSCDDKGDCVHTNNTKACNDNNDCTTTDVCQGGSCNGSGVLSCDDNNPCTDDSCKIQGGCAYANNSGPCDDRNVCTTNEQCTNGACIGFPTAGACDDLNPCTNDSCDAALGCVNANNSNPCNDSNPCSDGDQCTNGQCAGTPKTCGAGDQCHEAGVCDRATGLCSNPTKPDGSTCTDDNACTASDTCQKGVCVSSAPKTCTASDQCHDPGTCDPQNGTCSNPTKPNGTPCNDQSSCSADDQCTNGVCGGTTLDCKDNNPCTDDTCGPNGCIHTNNTASCDDGNLCTTGDICGGGTCKGAPKVCDSNNFCSGPETCNANTGACETNPQNPAPFLFCSSARINNRGIITGDLTVNDPNGLVHLSRGVYMADGTKLTAHEVELAASASVCSVFANTIQQDQTAEIRCGTGTPSLPVMTPCCAIPQKTDCTQSITLPKNGTLALTPGEHVLCSVDIALGAKVTTSGATTIHVVGDFNVADLAYFGPDAGQPLPTINIGGTDIRIGEAGLVRGLVSAPHAEARFGRQAVLEGTMCIDAIGTDKGITLSCTPQQNVGKIKRQRRRNLRASRQAKP